MSVRVYVIGSNLRPWSKWLGGGDVYELKARKFLKETGNYSTDDQHLVLIHGADDEQRAEDRERYLRLSQDLQRRLWLLYYSGGGYQHARESDLPDHIHH